MNSLLTFITEKPPLCGPKCRQTTVRLLWLFLLLYPIHQYFSFGTTFTQWDLLLFSGVATFILGLRWVDQLPDQLQHTLTRLERRGVLRFEAVSKENFIDTIEKKGHGWARATGMFCALAMLLVFGYVLSIAFTYERVLLGVAEILGAYVCGNYLGHMIGYGRLGAELKKASVGIKVDPLHVDGVGGFKPIGDFFFAQALIASLPAIFLAVWWFLFPIWPRDYSHWQDAYVWLFSLALVVEALAFLLPLWSFHRLMLCQKRAFQADADALSARIHELQQVAAHAAASAQTKVDADEIEVLKTQYWAIENMATWPVDVRTRRKFRINNVLLVIPLLGDIGKHTIDWQRVSDVVQSLVQ